MSDDEYTVAWWCVDGYKRRFDTWDDAAAFRSLIARFDLHIHAYNSSHKLLPPSAGSGEFTVYLCGSLSGHEDGNRPAFKDAAEVLRNRGIKVVSPVELDEQEGRPGAIAVGDPRRNEVMARDLTIVCDPTVDALCVLPGWEGSRGFADEASVARMIGKPILLYPSLEPLAESVLQEAERIVNGARSKDYGHPRDHALKVSQLWAAGFGWDVDPVRVGLAMILFKLARADVGGNRDSLVDIAGYARTIEATVARAGAEDFRDLD